MEDKLEIEKILAHTHKNITLLCLDKSPQKNQCGKTGTTIEGFYY